MLGVSKLVHHLARHKIPIAVASSSSSPSYQLKTQHHSGLFSLFDAVVLGDDQRVRNAKPAPDIFLTAADCLGESQLWSLLSPSDSLSLIFPQVSSLETVWWWRTLLWAWKQAGRRV